LQQLFVAGLLQSTYIPGLGAQRLLVTTGHVPYDSGC
jgi:hypothetical protein